MLALTPMLLGDQLVLIVANAMRDCGVWFDQASTYLTQMLS